MPTRSPDDILITGLINAFSSLAKAGSAARDNSESERIAEYIAVTHASPRMHADPGGEAFGFEIVRQDDADFDVDAFYGRVTEMFLAVRAAIDARRPDSVRHFLSREAMAGVIARSSGPKAEPVTGPLHVERCKALSLQRDGGQDVVRIRIVARRSLGSKVVSEYWTLKRDVGARSKAGATVTRCPHCGAPLNGLDRVRCAYCGTQLCDPALDWIVDHIAVEGN